MKKLWWINFNLLFFALFLYLSNGALPSDFFEGHLVTAILFCIAPIIIVGFNIGLILFSKIEKNIAGFVYIGLMNFAMLLNLAESNLTIGKLGIIMIVSMIGCVFLYFVFTETFDVVNNDKLEEEYSVTTYHFEHEVFDETLQQLKNDGDFLSRQQDILGHDSLEELAKLFEIVLQMAHHFVQIPHNQRHEAEVVVEHYLSYVQQTVDSLKERVVSHHTHAIHALAYEVAK